MRKNDCNLEINKAKTRGMSKSPLRYPGGKTRACKVLDDIVVENFGQPSMIYSPFFGGGSFELYMTNKYHCQVIAADGFLPLANFWEVVQSGKVDTLVAEATALKPVTKEKFKDMRKVIIDVSVCPVTRAAHYYALNRCSFSGATLSGGFSADAEAGRFNTSAMNRLKALNMTHVQVRHQVFQEFLATVPDDGDHVLFLDPPYYVDSKLYGSMGDMHECFDHSLLANILKTKSKWILCYNDCEMIRKLYNGYRILNVSWSYGMNQSKKSSEIVILSS